MANDVLPGIVEQRAIRRGCSIAIAVRRPGDGQYRFRTQLPAPAEFARQLDLVMALCESGTIAAISCLL
jgi:hypothetical protein